MATWADILTPLEAGVVDRMPSTFDTVPGVTIAAHRSGAGEAPENTSGADAIATAIAGFAARGCLETDVYRNSSLDLVRFHDATVPAATTSISSDTAVASINSATWPTITHDAVNGNGPFALSFFEDMLDTYGGVVPIAAEAKTSGAATDMIAMIVAKGLQRHVLFQSFTQSQVEAAVAAGITGMVVYSTAPTTGQMDGLVTAGIAYFAGARASINTTVTGDAHSRGLRVWCYTATTTTHFTDDVAKGVDGVFTDVPAATFAL